MIAYLDTSGLIKLVVDEPGSDLASRVWDGADLRVTSILTYAEARAALAAARRQRQLSPSGASSARSTLDDRWSELAHASVSDEVVAVAGDLSDRAGLRGYDVVHLATALHIGQNGDLLIATWDRALARAAIDLGTAVSPPVA